MRIYVIDDKKEQLEKAYRAVLENGHEFEMFGRELELSLGSMRGVVMYNADPSRYPGGTLGHVAAQREIFRAVEKMKEVGGGIITDMMFYTTSPMKEDDEVPPSGILVIIHALAAGIPVVVCTDEYHHSKSLHWIFDGYVAEARRREVLPFGWIENKDWDAAVKLLEQLHARQQKKEVTK